MQANNNDNEPLIQRYYISMHILTANTGTKFNKNSKMKKLNISAYKTWAV